METRRSVIVGAVSLALCAAIPALWLYGFTVDDALLPARIAAHLRRGYGHRFNINGPVVDAVTPFGWAYLLAPFAGGGPLGVLRFAKGLGAAAWLVAAAALGARIARGTRAMRWAVLLPLATCAPLAAWSVSGMETGVVIALATAAVVAGRPGVRGAASGVAVALRPELVPWSVALA